MKITVPFLLVLTAIILVMMRIRHRGEGLTSFEFILCATWGFLLCQTGFAPAVNNFLKSILSLIGVHS